MDNINSFLDAIRSHGLEPPNGIEPGKLYRFPGAGKDRGNKAAWCRLFEDCLGGAFGDWSSGVNEVWQAKREFTPEEKQAFLRQVEENRKQREEEDRERWAQARKIAEKAWEAARPETGDHRYLRVKEIGPHGVRTNGHELIIPARNNQGIIYGVQAINPSGDKELKKGTRKKGCYFAIGGKPQRRIYIAEGFATGASVYEATGEPVAIAFDTGNLLPVAKALREKYPAIELVFAADNDIYKPGNPGVTAATKAAAEVGGAITKPIFKGNPEGLKDFNDLFQLEGPEELARQLAKREKAPINGTPKADGWPGDPPGEEEPIDLSKVTLSYTELLEAEIPERKKILPWLVEGGLVMVFGMRGLGKTYFGLSLAAAVAQGQTFMRWPIEEPEGVLFIDGEMPLGAVRERLQGFIQSPPPKPLITLSHECFFEKYERDLVISQPETQQAILNLLDANKEIRLVILDNLSSLSRVREDKSDDWRHIIQPFLTACRRRGVSVLVVHHAGKGGDQRGTGAREDQLDITIKLTFPDGTNYGEEGCCFRVDFMKARGCYGDVVAPFNAKLQQDPYGRNVWSIATIEEGDKDRLISLIASCGEEGITAKEAAEELELRKQTISRYRQQLENEGVIRTATDRRKPMVIADNWAGKKG